MAKQLTDTEVAWAILVKTVRSQIRLRHSLIADKELFNRIPKLEREFTAAVKAGTARDFVLSEITKVTDAAS